MSIPDVVSTSFKLGPGGAAGVAGSSAANATPDVAKLSISARAINCFPLFFILFIPHTLNIETPKSQAKGSCPVALPPPDGTTVIEELLHSFAVERKV